MKRFKAIYESEGLFMHTVLTYFVTLIAMGIAVFITLFFKFELERMFREEKGVIAFHICNVLIILMTSFAVHAVTTTYIMGNEFKFMLQIIILLFMILPIYIFGHFAFKKYKLINRKYTPVENGKVLVINEKFLKRK